MNNPAFDQNVPRVERGQTSPAQTMASAEPTLPSASRLGTWARHVLAISVMALSSGCTTLQWRSIRNAVAGSPVDQGAEHLQEAERHEANGDHYRADFEHAAATQHMRQAIREHRDTTGRFRRR